MVFCDAWCFLLGVGISCSFFVKELCAKGSCNLSLGLLRLMSELLSYILIFGTYKGRGVSRCDLPIMALLNRVLLPILRIPFLVLRWSTPCWITILFPPLNDSFLASLPTYSISSSSSSSSTSVMLCSYPDACLLLRCIIASTLSLLSFSFQSISTELAAMSLRLFLNSLRFPRK